VEGGDELIVSIGRAPIRIMDKVKKEDQQSLTPTIHDHHILHAQIVFSLDLRLAYNHRGQVRHVLEILHAPVNHLTRPRHSAPWEDRNKRRVGRLNRYWRLPPFGWVEVRVFVFLLMPIHVRCLFKQRKDGCVLFRA
jgi:hypothetical protein